MLSANEMKEKFASNNKRCSYYYKQSGETAIQISMLPLCMSSTKVASISLDFH